MFTNNFKLWQRVLFWGGAYSGGTSVTGNSTTLNIPTSGTPDSSLIAVGSWLSNARIKDTYTGIISGGGFSDYCGVYFGSGTTPPAPTDYKLESVITDGLTLVSRSRTLGEISDSVYAAVGTYELLNSSEADISISEVGLFIAPKTGNDCYLHLMDRTVLAKPIIIAPGEIKTISYKITINQN
jgi:hypothetical protein